MASQTTRRQGSRSVAAADLVIPHPPSPLVLRPRLFKRLNEGTNGPLTLVSAPAGAGKTSLLSSWLSAEPRTVSWLTARANLSEAVFWSEFLAALQRVVPARSALSRVAAPRSGSPPGLLVELLNGFAELEEPVIVVVDDFQNVRSAAVSATFEQLLRTAPESLRLVLSTRHDPVLPLHLFRASGELNELRAHHLAFREEETEELLVSLGVELKPPLLSLLQEQTEGWAAGLRLYSLAHRVRDGDLTVLESLAIDGRFASEYLLAEVLDGQPEEVRDFLLATSIVERFTPELAEALTGRADSAHLCERLVADNVFIERLDTQPVWYRYHHLFAELLRAELRHTDRGRLRDLHSRAAKWYFDSRSPIEAVGHALAAGDTDLVARSLVDGCFELIARTDASFRVELLEGIAEGDVDGSAQLSAVLAAIDFINGHGRTGVRRLNVARKSWPKQATPAEQAVRTLRRCWSLREGVVHERRAVGTGVAGARRERIVYRLDVRHHACDRACAPGASRARARPSGRRGNAPQRGAGGITTCRCPVRGARQRRRPRLGRADQGTAAPLGSHRPERRRARAATRLGGEPADDACPRRPLARGAGVGRPRRS